MEKAVSAARERSLWSSSSHIFAQEKQLLGARDMGSMFFLGDVVKGAWADADSICWRSLKGT